MVKPRRSKYVANFTPHRSASGLRVMALTWHQAHLRRALLVVAMVLAWLACQVVILRLASRAGRRIPSGGAVFWRNTLSRVSPHWHPAPVHGAAAHIQFGALQVGVPAAWQIATAERTHHMLRATLVGTRLGGHLQKIILYAYHYCVGDFNGISGLGGCSWSASKSVAPLVSIFYDDFPRFMRRYPTDFKLWMAVLRVNPVQLPFKWGAARWRVDALLLLKADIFRGAYMSTPRMSAITEYVGRWRLDNRQSRMRVNRLRDTVRRHPGNFNGWPMSGYYGPGNTGVDVKVPRSDLAHRSFHRYYVFRVLLFSRTGVMEPARLITLVRAGSPKNAETDLVSVLSLTKLASVKAARPGEPHNAE